MNKFYMTILMLVLASTVLAEKKQKLWVKIDSSTVNEVFFSLDDTYSGQKVENEWMNIQAGYFYLNNGGVIKEKTGADLTIAQEWYQGYKKSDPVTGKWVQMSPAEKAAVDAANKEAEATKLAQEAVTASLRELINETFGSPGTEITEQELIDRIDSKL